MNATKIPVQVHRFRDMVAISLHTGETVYLSASDAQALGSALVVAANDVSLVPFTESLIRIYSATYTGKA